ncbi:hypothetical protein OV203_10785 [Nannocystis sp. ILAH1]|uniref:hypothetical protein n=1 Tax=Nannocystis sp. ILAH1 TaxID=2996789 RepID=UPI00226FAE58|nr:hypothetical protein [Nannocystis sp. ILAH1]MCY0987612.1 hypothetical protein [Nannocystis sp. ILAH1]
MRDNFFKRIFVAVLAVTGCDAGSEIDEGERGGLLDSIGRPLGPVSRRIVEANRELEPGLRLLARVEVQPDELLQIYEPAPGELLISLAGAPVNGPRLEARALAGRSLPELWADAAGEAAMPAALAEVADALGDAPVVGPRADLPLAAALPDPSPAVAGYCDTAFFKHPESACEVGGGLERDYAVCVEQVTSASGWVDHAFKTRGTVCPNRGDVVLRLKTGGGGDGGWAVPQHTHNSVIYTNYSCTTDDPDIYDTHCRWVNVWVDAGGPRRFHFRMVADVE